MSPCGGGALWIRKWQNSLIQNGQEVYARQYETSFTAVVIFWFQLTQLLTQRSPTVLGSLGESNWTFKQIYQTVVFGGRPELCVIVASKNKWPVREWLKKEDERLLNTKLDHTVQLGIRSLSTEFKKTTKCKTLITTNYTGEAVAFI